MEENSVIPQNGPRFGKRHIQVLFLFMLTTIAFGIRGQLPIAIVAMTNKSSENPDVPIYTWDNKGLLLSSFYWGYIILQVFAAELAKRFGAKNFLLAAMTVNSTMNMLVPLSARLMGSYGVMGCRTIQGLAQGFFYPCVHNILGKWAPVNERSLLSTVSLSGGYFGSIVPVTIAGLLCSSWVGWESSFYLFGAVGFVWVLFYAIFGASSPTEHKSISKAEKMYIESSLDSENTSELKTPWKSIFTSLPFWAIYVTQVAVAWGQATLMAEMPNYMDKVMDVDMKSNAFLSALPPLAAFIFGYSFSFLSDHIITKNYLSITSSRKVFTLIATIIPAAALFVLGYLPEDDTTLSVVMLAISVGFQSAQNSGFVVNHIDLSPTFAGTLMGIANSTANISSILGPLVVQFVVTDEEDKSQWRIIFIVAASLSLIPSIFYTLFASGNVQPWDPSFSDNSLETIEKRKKISVYSIISIN